LRAIVGALLPHAQLSARAIVGAQLSCALMTGHQKILCFNTDVYCFSHVSEHARVCKTFTQMEKNSIATTVLFSF